MFPNVSMGAKILSFVCVWGGGHNVKMISLVHHIKTYQEIVYHFHMHCIVWNILLSHNPHFFLYFSPNPRSLLLTNHKIIIWWSNIERLGKKLFFPLPTAAVKWLTALTIPLLQPSCCSLRHNRGQSYKKFLS